MFHTSHDDSNQPARHWARRHPRLALAVVIALAAVIVALVLANTHHSGMMMITPGRPGR